MGETVGHQLILFEGSVHLERCMEDPDPYASESVYYTPWHILYSTYLVAEYVESLTTNQDK